MPLMIQQTLGDLVRPGGINSKHQLKGGVSAPQTVTLIRSWVQ